MDYEEQQSVATEQARTRKEREIAEVGVKNTANATPEVRRARRRIQDGNIPLPSSDRSKRERKPRATACGRQECGGITTTPGLPRHVCPRGVHVAGDKLCAGCHSTADEKGLNHIVGRISAAVDLVASRTNLLGNVVRVFRPGCSDCLYRREDCFHHLVVQEEAGDRLLEGRSGVDIS